jgi:hypothetical protein
MKLHLATLHHFNDFFIFLCLSLSTFNLINLYRVARKRGKETGLYNFVYYLISKYIKYSTVF